MCFRCVSLGHEAWKIESVGKVGSAGLVLRSQQIAVTTHLPAELMEPPQGSAPLLVQKEGTGEPALCCDKPDLPVQNILQSGAGSALLGLPSVPTRSW